MHFLVKLQFFLTKMFETPFIFLRISCSQFNLRSGVRWYIVAFNYRVHTILGVWRDNFGRTIFTVTELAPFVYCDGVTWSTFHYFHVVRIILNMAEYRTYKRVNSISLLSKVAQPWLITEPKSNLNW